MLIPKRNFLTVWDISLIQCIGNALVGSPGIIEGKYPTHYLQLLWDDLQGTVLNLVAVQDLAMYHLSPPSNRSLNSSLPWRRNRIQV